MSYNGNIFEDGRKARAAQDRAEVMAATAEKAEREYNKAKARNDWKAAAYWAEVYGKSH